VTEAFPTAAPISLYGATKLASEALALEYHHAFGVPVWVNRCGVLAGAGQFGHPAQGIYAYWINAHLRRRPLRYIGFGGSGHQVRDCLHPDDLGVLILRQIEEPASGDSMSLAQLTSWCDARFGPHAVDSDPRPRPFDVPWMVLDPAAAALAWQWSPYRSIDGVLEEIAAHAERNPHWLELSGGA
jgi:CDP-paratose 2-epimerase